MHFARKNRALLKTEISFQEIKPHTFSEIYTTAKPQLVQYLKRSNSFLLMIFFIILAIPSNSVLARTKHVDSHNLPSFYKDPISWCPAIVYKTMKMAKNTAYTVMNHTTLPSQAVIIVRAQVHEYVALTLLCDEIAKLASQGFIAQELYEFFLTMKTSYEQLIEQEIERLQEFSGRLCDCATDNLLYNLEKLYMHTKDKNKDKACICIPGIVLFKDQSAFLYKEMGTMKKLDERIVSLYKFFYETHVKHQKDFDETVACCLNIACVYRIVDYVDLLYTYMKHSVRTYIV